MSGALPVLDAAKRSVRAAVGFGTEQTSTVGESLSMPLVGRSTRYLMGGKSSRTRSQPPVSEAERQMEATRQMQALWESRMAKWQPRREVSQKKSAALAARIAQTTQEIEAAELVLRVLPEEITLLAQRTAALLPQRQSVTEERNRNRKSSRGLQDMERRRQKEQRELNDFIQEIHHRCMSTEELTEAFPLLRRYATDPNEGERYTEVLQTLLRQVQNLRQKRATADNCLQQNRPRLSKLLRRNEGQQKLQRLVEYGVVSAEWGASAARKQLEEQQRARQAELSRLENLLLPGAITVVEDANANSSPNLGLQPEGNDLIDLRVASPSPSPSLGLTASPSPPPLVTGKLPTKTKAPSKLK
eukprot:TRINITY_DN5154_c0_g1_i1.p1 TRINITY_DN5154_c0_g1~~TRINITY_DN5154_c0_g1_i1.p1  ORF type:complete len:359 (-),score=62.03 TRINITY_DN5154_c0_g1_i1:155-1231(-)